MRDFSPCGFSADKRRKAYKLPVIKQERAWHCSAGKHLKCSRKHKGKAYCGSKTRKVSTARKKQIRKDLTKAIAAL